MSDQAIIPVAQTDVLIAGHSIVAVLLPDGQPGAVLTSLCAALDLKPGTQAHLIHNNPVLSEALVLVALPTSGGTQTTNVLLAWAIALWAAGLHPGRRPPAYKELLRAIQREAAREIARQFAQVVSSDTVPPPSPSPAPQSVWQVWHTLGNLMEAKDEEMRREFQAGQQELHDEMTVMRYDQQRLALHFAALEARDASPAATISPEQLAHIFRLARQLAARKGLPVLDILAILAEHFRVEDVSVLPAKDWPAVLDWFSSMLEA